LGDFELVDIEIGGHRDLVLDGLAVQAEENARNLELALSRVARFSNKKYLFG
jgi:hypothetical protein